MRHYILVFFALVGGVFSCENPTDTNNLEPSHLEAKVTVSTSVAGLVEIEANADNTTHYEFDMGDNSELISSTTGIISYTYTETNIYEIVIKAYGESGRFLKTSELVTIDLGDASLFYEGYTLVWSDEFTGNALNQSKWNYERGTGSGGWGNNELQYYREENTSVDDGHLTIEARRETIQGSNYTSSRLTTQNKFSFQYGRVDISAKLPQGQGIWPALWMLGDNFSTVGWPRCGEIDIMEMVGGGEGRDDKVHGTIHWDDAGNAASTGEGKQLASEAGIFNDQFHLFSIVWTAQSIRWYLDNQQFYVVNTTPSGLSEFRNSFFLIFNVAVGGNWPGNPNGSTMFPQQMVVDYVRVFQEN